MCQAELSENLNPTPNLSVIETESESSQTDVTVTIPDPETAVASSSFSSSSLFPVVGDIFPESNSDLETVEQYLQVSSDPAEWIVNDTTIDYLLSSEIKQNIVDFSDTKKFYPKINKFRCLKKSVFRRKLINGENQERKYLIYSISKKALFCVPCRLFGGSSKLATDGFTDWSNVQKGLSSHERSTEHNKCQLAFLNRCGKVQKRVDTGLQEQIQEEMNYWRNVLQRVVATVKKLTSRGLALRGDNELFGSNRNGNFFMCLELISEFDPFLSAHIAKYGNPGPGKTSYLSSRICNEFIELIALKVRKIILDEIKCSKYFSIIVDSTPDISHVDELALIIRYVKKDGTPVERFIQYIPNVGHKGKAMEQEIMSTLASLGLNLNDCRGQSYDNASNMSGCYNGLQALILNANELAIYCPCAAHRLNLVGKCSVESNPQISNFFDLLQNLYSFLAASTYRWQILKETLKPEQRVVKRVDGTRWSSRYDANACFCEGWNEIMKTLQIIEDNKSEKPENRRQAAGLRSGLSSFESVFIGMFWNTLLERFHKTHLSLQSVKIDLGTVRDLYESLINFVITLRTDNMFQEFIDKAKRVTEEKYAYDIKRRPVRKPAFDETGEDEIRNRDGKEKLKIEVYFAALDKIRVELQDRCAAYVELFKRFNFLITIQTNSMSSEDIIREAKNLQQQYKDDLEATFPEECLHFQQFVQNSENIEGFQSPNFLTFLYGNGLDAAFPNVCIAFRIFLCLAVTNCSAERAFSYLKRIKNYLRSSLKNEKLNSLAILAIESELVQSIDFNDIINEFAHMKTRRKMM